MKKQTAKKKLSALLVVALGLAIAPQSHATLIAYDGFFDGGSTPRATANPLGQYQTSPASTNGTDNSALSGQAPVLTGFSGANTWSNNGGVNNTVHPRAAAGGLSYTGLATTSGQAEIFRSGSASGSKGAQRTATTTDTSSVQWVSMLMQQDNARTMTTEARWHSDVGRALKFGLDATQNAYFNSSGADEIGQTSTGTYALDTPHLFVLKLEAGIYDVDPFSNSDIYDQITMWVNPDLSLGEGGLGTGLVGRGIVRDDLTTRNLSPFHRLNIFATPDNDTFVFDEFRLGTTFSDVAPIPEPGTFVMMLICGLGLLMFSRRSRRRIAARI